MNKIIKIIFLSAFIILVGCESSKKQEEPKGLPVMPNVQASKKQETEVVPAKNEKIELLVEKLEKCFLDWEKLIKKTEGSTEELEAVKNLAIGMVGESCLEIKTTEILKMVEVSYNEKLRNNKTDKSWYDLSVAISKKESK